MTDDESIGLLIDRVAVLQKETYAFIEETEETDAPTSDELQDLAYGLDETLWQLRIHLQKPGRLGQDLPYAPAQGGGQAGG